MTHTPNQPPSATFCVLPWIHLSTRPNGHMRVCCTANASSAGATQDKKWGGEVGILKMDNGKPANLNSTDLMSGWNNGYMRDVRQKMLKGEVPNSCTKCFKEEAAGHRSKRNWETEYWSKRVDIDKLVTETSEDGSVPPQIYYVDLRLGTKCNLKCVMCSPHDSSLWVSDWNKLYPKIENKDLQDLMNWDNKGRVNNASYDWHKDNPEFWDQLYSQIPNMQQLYFAGGESTIIEEHYTLLEECIRRGEAHHIELRYNSNGIELPDRLFDIWKHFKLVRFHFSIDSIGKMNEYIRFPSEWPLIERNLRKLDETGDHVEVTIACAVQVLNMYYIPDFIQWKIEQKFKKINAWPLGAGLINYHFVYHPAHLNVKVFPAEMKKKIREKYEVFFGWLTKNYRADLEFINNAYGINRLQGMLSFMDSEDWSQRLPQFREYIRLMDDIRKTSFVETFPEMAVLLDEPIKHVQMAAPEMTI
jgi:MoaA/NifB/PqqE/SkfB family radical SAM enzyme